MADTSPKNRQNFEVAKAKERAAEYKPKLPNGSSKRKPKSKRKRKKKR